MVGTAGVTDANDDGVVDVTDVQAFMDVRLDQRAKDYFADSNINIDAQGLIDSTEAEIATHKTNMTSVDGDGNGNF